MADKPMGNVGESGDVGHSKSDGFPETQTAILAEAAEGKWDRFLAAYLAPCWREIAIACRTRRIPLDDADDLYQELILRLLRDGQLRLAAEQRETVFKANVPARFLKYRELTLRSAKFRTVLKSVVQHLILEYYRKKKRLPKPIGDLGDAAFDSVIAESVTSSVARQWLAECLRDSARQLQNESQQATTRGKRRLFEVLFRTIVTKESSAEIAAEWRLDRTTVSELVTRSRSRFVELLQQATEIESISELKEMVVQSSQLLVDAMTEVYGSAYG